MKGKGDGVANIWGLDRERQGQKRQVVRLGFHTACWRGCERGRGGERGEGRLEVPRAAGRRNCPPDAQLHLSTHSAPYLPQAEVQHLSTSWLTARALESERGPYGSSVTDWLHNTARSLSFHTCTTGRIMVPAMQRRSEDHT